MKSSRETGQEKTVLIMLIAKTELSGAANSLINVNLFMVMIQIE